MCVFVWYHFETLQLELFRTIAADSYCIRLDLHSFSIETSCSSQQKKHNPPPWGSPLRNKRSKKSVIWHSRFRFYPPPFSLIPLIPLILPRTIASSVRWSTFLVRNVRNCCLYRSDRTRFYTFLRSSIFIRHWRANAQVDESDKRLLRLYFSSE